MANRVRTITQAKDAPEAFMAIASLLMHLPAYGITVSTATLSAGRFTLNLSGDFPDDEIKHVGMEAA
jgi:hypothetical protein